MWISKIELTNFKSYQYQEFTFPKPTTKQNLSLVGGMNGFGKTTLLEAIYLCLYGSEATSHLGRAGLADDSYGRFLKNAFHGKAKMTKRDFMAVNIAFEVDDYSGYEIRRKWHFQSSGIFDEEDLQIGETKNGTVERFLDNDDLSEILLNHVVPPHVAPFFFFDGEELKRNADQNKTAFILMGLENLLGVVHLKHLKDRLENYANQRLVGTSKVDKEELETTANNCDVAKTDRDIALNQLTEIRLSIDVARAKRDEVHLNIQSSGAGSGDKKQIEETLQEEGQRRADRDKAQDQLSVLLTTKLPFNLISKKLRDLLEGQLIAEEKLEEWTKRKDALAPQRGKFKDSFFEQTKNNEDIKQKNITSYLDKAIDIAWESIYTPQPDGCATNVWHDYLDGRQRSRVIEMINSSKVNGAQIKELSVQVETLNSRIDQLTRRRVQLQSILGDGQLQEWLEQLKVLEDEIEGLRSSEGNLDRQVVAANELISQLQATIERERKRIIESSPQRSYASKAQKVIDFIDELLPKLFLLKTEEVSKAVTETFKRLSHKNLVDKILVNEKGESKIFDENGKEISVDLSAGEKQMFVTSMIAGLAQVSGFEIPIIVDTPLGRLDSVHRKKILDYWIDTGRQVILLSQDEEIGPDEYTLLKKHIAKTYLLEHQVLGEGIGKTVAYENRYFDGVSK
jgi:DNA sulfur modification protein DndD